MIERDENGLVKGCEYKYTPDGFVDWRAMIPEEDLYPNKSWFEERNLEVPETTVGLEDNQCLIKLGGLTKLLALRGFVSVDTDTKREGAGDVSAKCSIVFAPHQDSFGLKQLYTANANASFDNCSGFEIKFLETIAENRAFARCIRRYLKIDICSWEEMDKSRSNNPTSNNKNEANEFTYSGFAPQDVLKDILSDNHNCHSWEDFLAKLRTMYKDGTYVNDDVANWKGYGDIPAAEARTLLTIFQK